MPFKDWIKSAAKGIGKALRSWLGADTGAFEKPPSTLGAPGLPVPPEFGMQAGAKDEPSVEWALKSMTADMPGPHGLAYRGYGSGPEFDADAAREWTALNSSNVGEIRYLAAESILEIRFLWNAFYQYFQVPPEVYLTFLNAGPSYSSTGPGELQWNILRAGGYEYVRIGHAAIPEQQKSGWDDYDPDAVVRRLLPEETEHQGKTLSPSGLVEPVPQALLGGEATPLKHLPRRKWREASWKK